MPLTISNTMSKHQLTLAHRQCRVATLSHEVQGLLTILCTSLYAARQQDDVLQEAANVCCMELTRRITCRPPSDRYFRSVTELGAAVVDGGFQSIAGLDAGEILMPYDNG